MEIKRRKTKEKQRLKRKQCDKKKIQKKKNNDGIQIKRRPEKRKNKECTFDEKKLIAKEKKE